MDEIKRLSLLVEAVEQQRNNALAHAANLMVEVTGVRNELDVVKAELEALKARKKK